MLTNIVKFKHLNEQGEEFENFFPEFSWVLRDFSLSQAFKSLTPESYLEQCLEVEREIIEGTAERNQLKQNIKRFFPKTNCFSMPKPSDAPPETQSFQSLNPEFQQVCTDLVQKSMANPLVKSINDRPLTGYMLLGLALEYVDALNR